jgi:hypothetical protein
LTAWYRDQGRHDLAWRHTRDRWAILVSEVMLQQTQVPRVLDVWPGFMARFPTPQVMAGAGHIIDSLILPKILDIITSAGGSFRIKHITIGQARTDPSHALVEVRAGTPELLAEILAQISDHGATPTALQDCQLVAADMDGAFPEGFYSSTNQRTEVRLGGEWIEVADQEMDCGLVVEPDSRSARCIAMSDVQRGMQIVIGHAGVRVFPHQRATERQTFEFMNSSVSSTSTFCQLAAVEASNDGSAQKMLSVVKRQLEKQKSVTPSPALSFSS